MRARLVRHRETKEACTVVRACIVGTRGKCAVWDATAVIKGFYTTSTIVHESAKRARGRVGGSHRGGSLLPSRVRANERIILLAGFLVHGILGLGSGGHKHFWTPQGS